MRPGGEGPVVEFSTVPIPRSDVRRFKAELTPTWLAAAAVLAGQRPPDLSGPFRVVWLGCRAAFTPAVVAAVHPQAEVVAWDPDPARLAYVRRIGDEADLANLVSHERPSPPMHGGPSFDIVVIDGLLDSVDDQARRALVAASEALLRPGGLVCVTYRTVVGWSEIVPIVGLIRHLALRSHRDRVRAVVDARELLNVLREREVAYLARPAVRGWLDELATTGASSIVDQYVDRDLRPASHAQVAELFSRTGTSYIGSADPAADLRDALPPKLSRQVRSAPSVLLRETLDDLARRRADRVDLFCLGPTRMTSPARTRWLSRLRVVDLDDLTGPAAVKHRWAGMKAPQREAELRQALGSGQVHPLADEQGRSTAIEAASKLSGTIGGSDVPKEHRHIVVPMIGSALATSMLSAAQREALGMAAR